MNEVVRASAGCGKCVKCDTVMFYENGMATIKDIYEQNGKNDSYGLILKIDSFKNSSKKESETSYIHRIKNENKLISITISLGYEN